MISFRKYVENKMKIEMPRGNISGEWFYNNNLPIVVECCCCGMTMASPSAWIDEEGYVYCGTCSDMEEVG